mgnify:CR=1 FL=1
MKKQSKEGSSEELPEPPPLIAATISPELSITIYKASPREHRELFFSFTFQYFFQSMSAVSCYGKFSWRLFMILRTYMVYVLIGLNFWISDNFGANYSLNGAKN